MEKVFIPYDTVRNDAFKLVAKIYNSGFTPDVIYIPLRGGAYMGNVFSEFYKMVRKDERPVFYAAVVARSYTDIHKRDNVMIDGWTYDPQYLRNGDKVLFVDDVFDSGVTLNYLVEEIMQHSIPREDIKIAVHDYKVFPNKKELPIQPDFYCQKHVIEKEEDEKWIHYMSHEFAGLTSEEIDTHYGSDPELQELMKKLIK
ncbi:MAG: phosphoribosyltransferase [Spirochaetaceae bacterium]|jgi:hypoxanthine phosphoribosyltransferase|nr:phosphoribosyltransferase [Spirochaetaceae bacterium]